MLGGLRKLLAGGSDGNARLTAATAVVLSVLLAAEGLTLLGGVRRLLVPHIFLGLLLIPPILLKLASTGWRMLAYYRRVEEYVRKGPPHALLRMVVAPVLVASRSSSSRPASRPRGAATAASCSGCTRRASSCGASHSACTSSRTP